MDRLPIINKRAEEFMREYIERTPVQSLPA
jgi:hypothetical protein